jgi:hypothetical protein
MSQCSSFLVLVLHVFRSLGITHVQMSHANHQLLPVLVQQLEVVVQLERVQQVMLVVPTEERVLELLHNALVVLHLRL